MIPIDGTVFQNSQGVAKELQILTKKLSEGEFNALGEIRTTVLELSAPAQLVSLCILFVSDILCLSVAYWNFCKLKRLLYSLMGALILFSSSYQARKFFSFDSIPSGVFISHTREIHALDSRYLDHFPKGIRIYYIREDWYLWPTHFVIILL